VCDNGDEDDTLVDEKSEERAEVGDDMEVADALRANVAGLV